MSTNAILGSAAEANPDQGPQKHPHMAHIAGWDGSWSGWSAGVLALGIKAPEVQVRAFCTLPDDLRMLIAGPHPVVSPAFELVCMRWGIGSARDGREGIVGLRRLWRSGARPAADAATLSGICSLASDETCRGGYLITEVPDSPVMVLTVPLPKNNRDGTGAWRHLPVSVPPEMLQAGQFYL